MQPLTNRFVCAEMRPVRKITWIPEVAASGTQFVD